MPRVSSHWKTPVPLPRSRRRGIRRGRRDDDADESAADALEQASEEEGRVAVGKGDNRNAEGEGDAAENHEGLAAEPVGEEAGKEGGEDAAEQHGGDDDGELGGREVGGGLEIGERSADDADVDAVEEAAEARDEKQKRL